MLERETLLGAQPHRAFVLRAVAASSATTACVPSVCADSLFTSYCYMHAQHALLRRGTLDFRRAVRAGYGLACAIHISYGHLASGCFLAELEKAIPLSSNHTLVRSIEP